MRLLTAPVALRYRLQALVACVASALALPVCAADPSRHASIDDVVHAAAKTFFADTCRVGLSMAIVEGAGKSPRFFDYGSVSRARKQQPTSRTLYEIASVTKTFTGALAAKAVTEGRMEIDADFRKYLPGDYPNLQFDGKPITLRTLAVHTSGMPRDIPDTDAAMANADVARRPERLLAVERGFSPADFPAALHKTSLRSAPGTKEQYSNAAMKVIAMGLEHIYGLSFETLLRDAVFQPLGMRDTGFDITAIERKRLATGYGRDGKTTPYHSINAGASWGLYSDTADMARYVAWQLDGKDPAIAQAHALIDGNANDGKGMIWNEGTDHDERVLWHGGGSFGMSSQVVLYPESGQGFVLLANDACTGTEGALKDIAGTVHAATR